MKNEQYLRINSEEQAEKLYSDEYENLPVEERKKNKWAQIKGNKPSFQPLSQDDDDGVNKLNDMLNKNNEIDDRSDESSSTPISSSAVSQQSVDEELEASEYDDFDDEEQLQRYKLDFSNNSLQQKIRASNEFEDAMKRGKITIGFLMQAYQETRMESRRKRVEALLSVNTKSQRWYISFKSYLDLYDRGFPILLFSTIIWLFLTTIAMHWTLGTSLGVIFFIARISAKPFYWYIQGRHLARRRKQTMEIYEELNQIGMEFSVTPNKENNRTGTPDKNENKVNAICKNMVSEEISPPHHNVEPMMPNGSNENSFV